MDYPGFPLPTSFEVPLPGLGRPVKIGVKRRIPAQAIEAAMLEPGPVTEINGRDTERTEANSHPPDMN